MDIKSEDYEYSLSTYQNRHKDIETSLGNLRGLRDREESPTQLNGEPPCSGGDQGRKDLKVF